MECIRFCARPGPSWSRQTHTSYVCWTYVHKIHKPSTGTWLNSMNLLHDDSRNDFRLPFCCGSCCQIWLLKQLVDNCLGNYFLKIIAFLHQLTQILFLSPTRNSVISSKIWCYCSRRLYWMRSAPFKGTKAVRKPTFDREKNNPR